MDAYIKYEDETFHFPVNPFSVSVNGGKKYDTFDILYQGEKDFPSKAKRIRQMSLTTMFPSEYEPYCRYQDIPDPAEAMKKIIEWSESEAIVRLIITGDYGFNELVNIANYQEDESGSNQGDKYITLDIRVVGGDGSLEIITIKPRSSSPAPKLKDNRPKSKQQKTYTVKPGDSLWKIARRGDIYGNGAQWPKIYNANKGVIGNNPDRIYPGQKYIIPG